MQIHGFSFIHLALSIAILASGCTKDVSDVSSDESGKEDVMTDAGYARLELSTVGENTSKTQLFQYSVNWEPTDKITVFAGDNVSTNYEFSILSSSGSNAKFQGVVKAEDADATNFVVAYPYNADITLDGTTLSGIEIPSIQTLHPESFASGENPSVGMGGKTSLEFKNLGALICIPVSGAVKVKQIKITAPEGVVLAGKGSVDVSSQEPVLNMSDGTSNVITMNASTAIDATNGVMFYAVVAPQTSTLTCDIEVFLENGTSMLKQFSDEGLTRARIRPHELYVGYDAPVFYGVANCYICKPGDELEFDVTPHYASGWDTCSPTENLAFAKPIASADVVWKEMGLTGELTAVYSDGKVKVSGIAGSGNALVAVKDTEGKILWSYHIWVPVADPTKTLTYPMDPAFTSVSSYEVMPMALGAVNTSGDDAAGFYYQFGRKDPLGRIVPSTKAFVDCGVDWKTSTAIIRTTTGNVYDYSIQNPTKMLLGANQYSIAGLNVDISGFWGNSSRGYGRSYTKSVHDPCPAGYKTVPMELFTNFIKSGGVKSTDPKGQNINNDKSYFNAANVEGAQSDGGYLFRYDADKTDFYPFVGYRDYTTGNLTAVGTSASVYLSAFGGQSNTASRMAHTTTTVHLCSVVPATAGHTVRCVKE